MATLHLTAVVPAGQEREAALQLRAGCPAADWASVVALAAEVLAIQESEASGRLVLVIPADSAALTAAADAMDRRRA